MNRTALTVVGLGFFLSTAIAHAEHQTFTLDSALSHLSYAIESSPGVPLTTAQFAGSDTTSLSGTQTVNLTGSSVQFLSTGNIQFGLQPSPVDPAVGGAYPGSAAGQYGLLALSPGVIGGPGPGGTGLIAARDLVADATSGVIPLIGNTFDASQIVGAFVTGSLDVNLLVAGNPYVGTVSTVGSANNELAGGTLTSAGGIDTLTIPIYVEAPVTVSGVTVLEAISGQMVATAAVPEPSSITLACVAVAGLVGEALRVRRRRHGRCHSK